MSCHPIEVILTEGHRDPLRKLTSKKKLLANDNNESGKKWISLGKEAKKCSLIGMFLRRRPLVKDDITEAAVYRKSYNENSVQP